MSEFRYGDDNTIHSCGEVNVERDPVTGAVVAVWYRCAMLPFTDEVAGTERANDMKRAYKDYKSDAIKAIIFKRKP